MGAKFCSDSLSRTINSIRSKAFSLKIKVNKNVVAKLCSKNRVNYIDFKNVTNPDIAYILGLLWADGSVTFANNDAKTPQIKHTCVYYDSNCFDIIFEKTGDWGTYSFENKKSIGKNKMNANWTSNRELGEYLIANDYRDKCKSPSKILNNIPEKLHHHFYRGFFDGDGCITYYIKEEKYKAFSILFTGASNQNWNFLSKLFDEMDIVYKIRKLSDSLGKSSQIYIWRQGDVNKFCEYMYNDSNDSFLKRKYNKYLELIDYIKSMK